MKPWLGLFGIVLCFFSAPLNLLAEDHPDTENSAALDTKAVSENKIVQLTDHGIVPRELHIEQEDSLVFFLNSSSKAQAKIELDYGGKRSHCATSNLEIGKDDIARSKRPIPPQDFAMVCFPDKGHYHLKVFGLPANPAGQEAEIIVE